jgi:hypothetical protein
MARRASHPDLNDIADGGLARWRRLRLEQAGFEPGLAQELAVDTRYDLHAVLELIDRGCPAPLAARILAPIDDGPVLPGGSRGC